MKDLFARLTWVDYLAAIAFLRGCYVGYKSGFFPELLRIASYLVAVILTFRFHEEFAQFLTLNTFLNATTAGLVAFLALFVTAFGLMKLFSLLLLRLLKIGDGGAFAKIVGTAMGGARWMLLLSLFFMLIARSPLTTLKGDIEQRSVTGDRIGRIAPVLFEFIGSLSPQLAVPIGADGDGKAPAKAKPATKKKKIVRGDE